MGLKAVREMAEFIRIAWLKTCQSHSVVICQQALCKERGLYVIYLYVLGGWCYSFDIPSLNE